MAVMCNNLSGFASARLSSVLILGTAPTQPGEEDNSTIPIAPSGIWKNSYTPQLIIGDVFYSVAVLLQEAMPPFIDYSNTVSVKACIVSLRHDTKYCDVVDLSYNISESYAESGEVHIKLPANVTEQCRTYVTGRALAMLEVQLEASNYKTSVFLPISIVNGVIA